MDCQTVRTLPVASFLLGQVVHFARPHCEMQGQSSVQVIACVSLRFVEPSRRNSTPRNRRYYQPAARSTAGEPTTHSTTGAWRRKTRERTLRNQLAHSHRERGCSKDAMQ
jgi:hypothetical protein